MTFMPFTWQDEENKTTRILRENLENAVRQLTIEQQVVDAFRNDEIKENEAGNSEFVVEEAEEGDENPPDEECIEVTEVSTEENVKNIINDDANVEDNEGTDDNAEEAVNDGDNQDDGGTDGGDAE